MVVYSYLIEHDFGLAPNPFGAYCTLAVCKPKIRKSSKLKLGDWVIGTGSRALEDATGRILRDKIIYAMEVTEIMTLESYWDDERFQYKKPIMNGTLVTMFGDNFYHKDIMGNWIQEDSAHCNLDGTSNSKHIEIDTSGNNVLVSEHYYYFGQNAQTIPKELIEICHAGIGEKKLSEQLSNSLITWITSNFDTGIYGDPLSWNKYNQMRLF